jgi:hypothetical protein
MSYAVVVQTRLDSDTESSITILFSVLLPTLWFIVTSTRTDRCSSFLAISRFLSTNDQHAVKGEKARLSKPRCTY